MDDSSKQWLVQIWLQIIQDMYSFRNKTECCVLKRHKRKAKALKMTFAMLASAHRILLLSNSMLGFTDYVSFCLGLYWWISISARLIRQAPASQIQHTPLISAGRSSWNAIENFMVCINYHPLRFLSRTLSNTSANDWSSSGRPTARDADAHLRVTREERPFIPAASFPQDTRHSLIGKIVKEVSHIPETACRWNPPRIIMDGKWVKMNVRELRQGLRPWSGGPVRFHNKPGVVMWSLL